MSQKHGYIAPHKLQETRNTMGSDLYLVFDLLNTRLMQGNEFIGQGSQLSSARQRAELREAKKIVYQIKHPDSEIAVTKEEMAWALRKIIMACEVASLYPAAMTMRAIARMLAIDVGLQHELPRELDKKIGNAMKVLLPAAMPHQALAVAS